MTVLIYQLTIFITFFYAAGHFGITGWLVALFSWVIFSAANIIFLRLFFIQSIVVFLSAYYTKPDGAMMALHQMLNSSINFILTSIAAIIIWGGVLKIMWLVATQLKTKYMPKPYWLNFAREISLLKKIDLPIACRVNHEKCVKFVEAHSYVDHDENGSHRYITYQTPRYPTPPTQV